MSDLGGVVVVGRDAVQMVMFNRAALSLIDTYMASEAYTIQYRLTADGIAVNAAWFQQLPGGTFSGGSQLFSFDGAGGLAQVNAVEYDGKATSAVRVGEVVLAA